MHAAQNLIQKHLRNFYMESFGSTLSDLHEQKDTAGLTRFANSEILKFESLSNPWNFIFSQTEMQCFHWLKHDTWLP